MKHKGSITLTKIALAVFCNGGFISFAFRLISYQVMLADFTENSTITIFCKAKL